MGNNTNLKGALIILVFLAGMWPGVAVAEAGYEFWEWTGTAVDEGKVADPCAASTTVTMHGNYMLNANFVVQPTVVISSSAGGSVTTPGEGPFQYDYGTVVPIVAQADVDWHFLGWTGTAVDEGKVAKAYAPSTTVTMHGNYTLVAEFTQIYLYTGAGSDDSWCTADNWVDTVVPGPHVWAYIDLPGLPCAVVGGGCDAVCDKLTVGFSATACCLDITGGNLTVGTDFVIADEPGSQGQVTMASGTVDVGGELVVGEDGTGMMYLDDGTVNVGALDIGASASVDVNEGTLIIDGYAVEQVRGYAEAGYLTGYGYTGLRFLVIDYDVRNAGKTTVTADVSLYQAWNPSPLDYEVLVYPDVTLSWMPGDGIGSKGRHLVYFGTDYTAVEKAPNSTEPGWPSPEWQGMTMWDDLDWLIGELEYNKTYYWRIDEGNEDGSITKGNVWRFTTGADIYVDESATGGNNGTSWDDAYNYLQDALADPCLESGYEIWVAEGVYYPDADTVNPGGTNQQEATFQLINGVGIYGGFPSGGTWAQRDPNEYETILSGDIGTPDANSDNSHHVVTGSGTSWMAVLDGFTITAGNANGGGWNNSGGGMYNMGGNPMVTNCTFNGNLAMTGAGMSNTSNSAPTVTNCTFSANAAGDSGGGMLNSTSSAPTVTNCTFSSNEAAVQGGGMFNSASSNPMVTNCTFSGNLAAINGGGILLDSRISSATVTNCILWGNSAPSGAQIYDYGTSSTIVSYSDVEGGWAGATNIAEDPLFKDADGADDIIGTEDDDLRLSAYSPCIDAGGNSSVAADAADLDGDGDTAEPIPFDLDGNARFFDDPVTYDTGSGTPPIVDMGAYEFEDVCGDAEHPYPPGDVNKDCKVNFLDVAVLGLHWLECTAPECD
jgi:hypothetical protein